MSKLIIRHTAYNGIGLVAPILAAVISIPILIEILGPERFGILTLVWAIVNYFGILDLGLGRALTLELAVLLADGRDSLVNQLNRTALAVLLALGLIGSFFLFSCTKWIIGGLSANIQASELINTVHAMACAIPFIVLTAGVRGALEAKGEFGVINAIRVPMGILNFALPVAIAMYGAGRLDEISWALVVARALGLLLHVIFMVRAYPGTLGSHSLDFSWIRILLINGGWMTVSNVISPVMGYLDRFIVGFLLPAASVAYYATPQELILKIYLIPGALTSVLFPRFAAEKSGSHSLYLKSLAAIGAIVASACLIGLISTRFILSIWVGEEFAEASALVMQILIVGVFFGAVSSIPYTYLQAIGRANLTAVSHIAQLPIFLLATYFLTSTWGIEGAALAWSGRLCIDALVLFVAAQIMRPSAPETSALG